MKLLNRVRCFIFRGGPVRDYWLMQWLHALWRWAFNLRDPWWLNFLRALPAVPVTALLAVWLAALIEFRHGFPGIFFGAYCPHHSEVRLRAAAIAAEVVTVAALAPVVLPLTDDPDTTNPVERAFQEAGCPEYAGFVDEGVVREARTQPEVVCGQNGYAIKYIAGCMAYWRSDEGFCEFYRYVWAGAWYGFCVSGRGIRRVGSHSDPEVVLGVC
jgi:hypothetical protein